MGRTVQLSWNLGHFDTQLLGSPLSYRHHSNCKRGTYQILRYSEIHVHFSKIQLFTQIVKLVLSFVMKKVHSKQMQNRSILTNGLRLLEPTVYTVPVKSPIQMNRKVSKLLTGTACV